jgi:orotate phosphoribosyltransferase
LVSGVEIGKFLNKTPMRTIENVARELALKALEIGAIKVQPDNPFTWASGWKSPIYNDNRMFLFYPYCRDLIIEGLEILVEDSYSITGRSSLVIAGTSTAGIPHATLLANKLLKPMVYVRDKPKDHGRKNRIEGLDAHEGLIGAQVVLIEDLISTGGSSVDAVQAIRDAGGEINHCFSIFSYGFPRAAAMFKGEVSFSKTEDKRLSMPCATNSILRFDQLFEVGIEKEYFSAEHVKLLKTWSADPEKWSNGWKATHAELDVK